MGIIVYQQPAASALLCGDQTRRPTGASRESEGPAGAQWIVLGRVLGAVEKPVAERTEGSSTMGSSSYSAPNSCCNRFSLSEVCCSFFFSIELSAFNEAT